VIRSSFIEKLFHRYHQFLPEITKAFPKGFWFRDGNLNFLFTVEPMGVKPNLVRDFSRLTAL
jgi:hypothetical protein